MATQISALVTNIHITTLIRVHKTTLSFSFFFLLASFRLSESLASFSAIDALVSGPGTWNYQSR